MGSKQSKSAEKSSTKEASQERAETRKEEKKEETETVQCIQHTSVPPIVQEDAMIDLHPEEDVSMFLAPHPEHIPLHVFNDNDATVKGKDEVFVDFCVKLMPHQHTLFCERRERVCAAVGKIQEGEELEVDGLLDTTGGYWIRSLPGNKRSEYAYIEGTENCPRYTLTADDDGRYIAFQYAQLAHKSKFNQVPSLIAGNGKEYETKRTTNSLGPVRPGPPRMLDLRVEGGVFQVGEKVRAEGTYIGGREGLSEYWWFKIMKGKRVQLSEPLSVLNNLPGNHDPREYEMLEDDVGCVLKVKCRPIRSDGHRGEIFTSKASEVIISKQFTMA